jgi:hypothetical protein
LIVVLLAATRCALAQGSSVGPLQIPAPEGWQRASLKPGLVSWISPASDADRPGACSIYMTFAGFGANPNAFNAGWATARSLLGLPATLQPPRYVEKPLPAGLTMGRGAWAFAPQAGRPDYVALANIADRDFGQAFAALGTRAACEPAFSRFLARIMVEGASTAAAAAAAGGTGGNAANALAETYAQGRAEDQRRAAQREQERQQQDRLAQQRELQRQADNRLAQQREQDRINQQRIQDSYRR